MNSKIPAIAAAVVMFLVLPLAVLGIGLVGALGGPLAGGSGTQRKSGIENTAHQMAVPRNETRIAA